MGGPSVRPVFVVRGSGNQTGTERLPPGEAAARAQAPGVQVVRGKWVDVPKPAARAGAAMARLTPPGLSTVNGLLIPVEGAQFTSGYGPREHPILGGMRMHSGIDLAAPTGTPIRAAAAGTVEEVGPNGGYGNYVRIRHDGELATAYGHMSRFADGIRAGTTVRQGEVIGFVGSTGLSTGPHLHYEILRGGESVDPVPYLPDTGRMLVAAADRAGNGPNPARGSGP